MFSKLVTWIIWVLRNEPVRVVTVLQLGIVTAVTLGLLHLSGTQVAAIVTFATAVLVPGGEAMRSQVRPENRDL